MTDISYDTEFLDNGNSIDLISIGLVCGTREYYAINVDAPWERIRDHKWLCDNVVRQLPLASNNGRDRIITRGHSHDFQIDKTSAYVKPKWVIANEVRVFIESTPEPKLWAWYSAFDHVLLSWLWGPMISMPDSIPKYTNDLRQELDHHEAQVELPQLKPTKERDGTVPREHHALYDARVVQFRLEWLRSRMPQA